MKLSHSVWLTGLFVIFVSDVFSLSEDARGSQITLPIEETVLTPEDVTHYPVLSFGEDLDGVKINNGTAEKGSANLTCKYIPEDSQWPSDFEWSVLNHFIEGSLVKPDPIAKVCFNGSTYKEAQCANITAEWTNSDLQ
jgi:hypothetical protein